MPVDRPRKVASLLCGALCNGLHTATGLRYRYSISHSQVQVVLADREIRMPVFVNRQGKLILVDRPSSHFLPPVPTPPSQHHVVRRTIYRRHSANAAIFGAHNPTLNYAHLDDLSGMLNHSTLEGGYVVIATRRFSLPASMTPSYAGHGHPRYSAAGLHSASLRTVPAPLHAGVHLYNANAQTQAYNLNLQPNEKTSTPTSHNAHHPNAEMFKSTPNNIGPIPPGQCAEKIPPIIPDFSMDKLRELMAKSNDSMKNLEEFDRRQGLRRCDAQNMVKTARSRKQLLDNKILSKWDGSPLIAFRRQADGSVKVLAGPSSTRRIPTKKHPCRRVVQRRM